MKLITRDTDYALRALCFIAKHKERLYTVSSLASDLGVPLAFLRKILQELNKNGIVKSHKGHGGGFVLAKPLEKIYLMDLMMIFQGEFELNDCTLKKRACPKVRACPLKKKLDNIERYVVSQLEPVSISSLLKTEH